MFWLQADIVGMHLGLARVSVDLSLEKATLVKVYLQAGDFLTFYKINMTHRPWVAMSPGIYL